MFFFRQLNKVINFTFLGVRVECQKPCAFKVNEHNIEKVNEYNHLGTIERKHKKNRKRDMTGSFCFQSGRILRAYDKGRTAGIEGNKAKWDKIIILTLT